MTLLQNLTRFAKVVTVFLGMNKNITLIAVIVAVVVIIGGGVFLLARRSPAPQNSNAIPTQSSEDQQVLSLKPEDIGLTLSRSTYTAKTPLGPALHMEITKLSGIKTIDCEIHYTRTNDTGDDQQEGLLCNIAIKPGMSTVSQDFPFGTCSDVCHYHKNIRDVEAIVKVTKTDGKSYQVDQKLPNE